LRRGRLAPLSTIIPDITLDSDCAGGAQGFSNCQTRMDDLTDRTAPEDRIRVIGVVGCGTETTEEKLKERIHHNLETNLRSDHGQEVRTPNENLNDAVTKVMTKHGVTEWNHRVDGTSVVVEHLCCRANTQKITQS
jgi:hypothetical protein